MGRGKREKVAAVECSRWVLGDRPQTGLQWRLMEHRLFAGAEPEERGEEAGDLSRPAILRDKYGNLAICRLSKGPHGESGGN